MSRGPQLRDIQLPPEPGLWPWPPGVWLLVVLALLMLAWGLRRLQRAGARRQALARWHSAMQTIVEDRSAPAVERVAAASELLRRAVRQHDAAAAALEGARWQAHLAALGPLPEGDRGLAVLVEGPWRERLDADEAALALTRAGERLQRLLERFP